MVMSAAGNDVKIEDVVHDKQIKAFKKIKKDQHLVRIILNITHQWMPQIIFFDSFLTAFKAGNIQFLPNNLQNCFYLWWIDEWRWSLMTSRMKSSYQCRTRCEEQCRAANNSQSEHETIIYPNLIESRLEIWKKSARGQAWNWRLVKMCYLKNIFAINTTVFILEYFHEERQCA